MQTQYLVWVLLVLGGGVVGSITASVLMARSQKKQIDTRLNLDKDRFVGIASHYLLTPMTGLQAALDLLYQSHNLDIAGRERLFAALKRSEARLSLTLQQLVLTNQLVSGPLRINQKPASLASLTSSVITSLDPLARQKSVTLQLSYASNCLQIRLDGRYARQAVSAVLDNAIKFAPENTTVVLEVKSTPEEGCITISDSGPGMSHATATQAASKFFRGTDLYLFDYEGIGLGLYVTKAIMEAHQGALEVESSPGNGTKVTLRFPNQ